MLACERIFSPPISWCYPKGIWKTLQTAQFIPNFFILAHWKVLYSGRYSLAFKTFVTTGVGDINAFTSFCGTFWWILALFWTIDFKHANGYFDSDFCPQWYWDGILNEIMVNFYKTDESSMPLYSGLYSMKSCHNPFSQVLYTPFPPYI